MLSKKKLNALLKSRILILDGAIGTTIQKQKLQEEDYRGKEFLKTDTELKGNHDLLNLTQPTLIKDIHKSYLQAGSDLIETNTFNSNSVSQSDYNLSKISYKLNFEGARLVREAIKEENKEAYVVGSICLN